MASRASSHTLAGIAGTLAFFGAWEALSRSGLVNDVMLPAPSTIVQAGWTLILDGELPRTSGGVPVARCGRVHHRGGARDRRSA